MFYLPDAKQMKAADTYTIHTLGVPSILLMEHAASGILRLIHEQHLNISETLIVCGSGNNGGDGFALARLMANENVFPTVVFAGKEESLTEESRLQKELLFKLGLPVLEEIPDREFTLVVDAVFGIGINRPIEGRAAEVIRTMNVLDGVHLAVDISSGVNASNGQIMGVAFQADLTAAIQCRKLGQAMYPGASCSGEVHVIPIGIREEILSSGCRVNIGGIDGVGYITPAVYSIDDQDLKNLMPKRRPDSHKGTYGKVLMLTGSEGMAGAAYLSAKACYASGAGLVQIHTAEGNRSVLQTLLPEAIISTYDAKKMNTEQALLEEIDQVQKLIAWADVICLGCGLGTSEIALQILAAVVQMNRQPQYNRPCVIDADGLNLLAAHPDLLEAIDFPVILTPHMKEMERLSQTKVSEIKQAPFTAMEDLLKKTKSRVPATLVLKDTRTIVMTKEQTPFMNLAGNASMAKGGSGDVLAGTITGILASMKEAPGLAAILGVYLHARGGDVAREKKGEYSVLASDLIDGIGEMLSGIGSQK